MICIALRTGDCDDDIKQAIATKLIALAKAGERNPDIFSCQNQRACEGRKALKINRCDIFASLSVGDRTDRAGSAPVVCDG